MGEMMYGIAWNDTLRLGEDVVDEQHKKLFSLLSNLVSACLDGSDVKKVKETLDFLVEYTVQHFCDEEALQIKCGFPEYERHRKLHEDFKVTVSKMVDDYASNGSTTELSNNLNRTVVRWLVNHIQGEDKKIGAFIRESGY